MACRADLANRALALAAVSLLFVMPVTARAGMRDPHPHALLQLAMDELDGQLDHHAPAVDAAAGGALQTGAHVHRGRHVDPFGLGPEDGHGAAQPGPSSGQAPETPAASGGAAWSPASAGLVWSFLAMHSAAWLAVAEGARPVGRPSAGSLFPPGRSPRPELPPPRSSPGFVAS